MNDAGFPAPIRNAQWAQPAGPQGYLTQLAPHEEPAFQTWVSQNKIPYDPSPTADYDMKGFWRSLQAGDGRAQTGMNPNDGKMHFTDTFKTPYHESFSAGSQFALPGAPNWNNQDQLVTPGGKVVFDEPATIKARGMPDPTPSPQLPGLGLR